jgi:MFS family permease
VTLKDAKAPTDTAHPDSTVSPATTLGGLAQLGLLVGPLLSMVDSSIVNVGTAVIARELGAPLDAVQWVVSGYLLALAAGLVSAA